MNASHYLRQIGAVIRKDLRREVRTRETLTTTIAFSVMLMVIFAFGFYQNDQTVAIVFPGILWISILFTSTLAITRTFDDERRSGCLRAIALAPGTEFSLYIAKLVVNLVFVVLFEIILVPMVALTFGVDLMADLGAWLAIIASCTVGFVVLGTLVAAMLVHSHLREVMLPILLYPLAVPIIIAGVKVSSMILLQESDRIWTWIQVVTAVDLVFLVVAQGLFRWVLSAIE